MQWWEVILSILLNCLPLGIFALPLLFLRQRSNIRLIYIRLFLGLVVFFIVYWVLPALMQYANIQTMEILPEEQGKFGLGIEFIFVRAFSLLTAYAQFPFILFPFIFTVSPFVSFFILLSRLRHESEGKLKGKLKDKIQALTYEYLDTPKKLVIKSLEARDWSKEIEMLKAFLVILPISLYLITVILDIGQLDPVNIAASSTALGWFIELFFVYLATFLFAYQLLKSSNISFRGRFIGEQIQGRFFTSLTQIGTPISILSILLFIVQNRGESLLFIVYFLGYFFMAAFIFIIYLRLFEPISILFFFKLINAWKKILSREKSPQNPLNFLRKKFSWWSTNIIKLIVFSCIGGFVVILVYQLAMGGFLLWTKNVPDGENFYILSLVSGDPTFIIAKLTEYLFSITSLMFIGFSLLLAFLFSLLLKTQLRFRWVFGIFSSILLGLTILTTILTNIDFTIPLVLNQNEAYIIGTPAYVTIFSFDFLTIRTGILRFSTEFASGNLLVYLSYPFVFIRPFANFVLWGFLIAYIDRQYFVKSSRIGENIIERTTYALVDWRQIDDLNNYPDYLIRTERLLDIRTPISLEEESLQSLYDFIASLDGISLKDCLISASDIASAAIQLRIGLRRKYFSLWMPEYSFQFEKIQVDSVYILYVDGRNLVYHNLRRENQEETLEPLLISGMFTAISCFVREATHSTDLLRAIDSGAKKVLLEYSGQYPIFGVAFANKEDVIVRRALQRILADFGNRFGSILTDWSGDIVPFKAASQLVEKIFISENLL